VHDNTIVKKTVVGDFSKTFWSNLSLAWLGDSGGPLYSATSNNRGANNHYWYDIPESLSVRYSWTAQYLTSTEFLPTPGGTGGRYLSTAEMNQVLTSKVVPLTAEAH
jgi:hypothetical protein